MLFLFAGTQPEAFYAHQNRAPEYSALYPKLGIPAAELSDHLLEDIGLTRAEVAVEINKYFWQR